jgi:hypothetical protein
MSKKQSRKIKKEEKKEDDGFRPVVETIIEPLGVDEAMNIVKMISELDTLRLNRKEHIMFQNAIMTLQSLVDEAKKTKDKK